MLALSLDKADTTQMVAASMAAMSLGNFGAVAPPRFGANFQAPTAAALVDKLSRRDAVIRRATLPPRERAALPAEVPVKVAALVPSLLTALWALLTTAMLSDL